MSPEIKKRVAFTYEDWPHFFDYSMRRRHFYNKTHFTLFRSKKAIDRDNRHYDRLTLHCYRMVERQVPGWKSYQIFQSPASPRYGESYKNSCVVIEVGP